MGVLTMSIPVVLPLPFQTSIAVLCPLKLSCGPSGGQSAIERCSKFRFDPTLPLPHPARECFRIAPTATELAGEKDPFAGLAFVAGRTKPGHSPPDRNS